MLRAPMAYAGAVLPSEGLLAPGHMPTTDHWPKDHNLVGGVFEVGGAGEVVRFQAAGLRAIGMGFDATGYRPWATDLKGRGL
jgi:hypothetical protein